MVESNPKDLLRTARSHQQAGRYEEAERACLAAKSIYESSGYLAGQAIAQNNLGGLYYRTGRLTEAFDAFELARQLGLSVGESSIATIALGNMGLIKADLGAPNEAATWHTEALELQMSAGNLHGAAVQHGSLGLLAFGRGALDDAERHLVAALEGFLAAGDSANAGSALNSLGEVRRSRGDVKRAREAFVSALDLLDKDEIQDERRLVVLQNLGNLARVAGELDDAEALFESSLRAATIMKDPRGEAAAHTNLGNVYLGRGKRAEARASYEASLRLHQKLGLRLGIAGDLTNLGHINSEEGDIGGAKARYEEAFAEYASLGHAQGEVCVAAVLAQTQLFLGHYAHARDWLERGLRRARQTDFAVGIALCESSFASLHVARGEFVSALQCLTDSERTFANAGDARARATTLLASAEIHAWLGNVDEARRRAREARVFFAVRGFPVESAGGTACLAFVQERSGRLDEARELYREACEVYLSHDHPAGLAQCYTALARVACSLDDADVALGFLSKAEPLWRVLQSPYGEAMMWSVRGEARMLRDEFTEARHALRISLEGFEAIGHAIGETLTLGRIARLMAISGARQEAIDRYALVGEQFRAMGMTIDADRTDQERRALRSE